MRVTLCRGLVFGALVLPCAAVVTAQQPLLPTPTTPTTPPDKLKAGTAALAADRVAAEPTSASDQRAKLQSDLLRLLERIDRLPQQPTGPMVTPNPPVPTPKKDEGGVAPVDRLRAATNLARDNQTEAALSAFRMLDLQRLSPDDRAFARYMEAACLRRLGMTTEALPIYREVSNAGDDPFLASAAFSQVGLLRESDGLKTQLAELRARPKNR